MNFSANGRATRPTILARPLIISASGLNGPNASGFSFKPFGDDFLSAGAKDAASAISTVGIIKKKPDPGYVDVRTTPSARVNVRSLNTWWLMLTLLLISAPRATIQPIIAARPLMISTARWFLNATIAESNKELSFPSGAASATDLHEKKRDAKRQSFGDVIIRIDRRTPVSQLAFLSVASLAIAPSLTYPSAGSILSPIVITFSVSAVSFAFHASSALAKDSFTFLVSARATTARGALLGRMDVACATRTHGAEREMENISIRKFEATGANDGESCAA